MIIKKILQMVDTYWKFDNQQQPISSWHDKQDCLKALESLDQKETERVVCAAIWYKELPTQHFLPKNLTQGIVVCGYRHGHVIDIVKNLSGLRTVKISPDGVGETIQGFLTNKDRFVDREEGAKIAKACGQIINPDYNGHTLYSEDLY